MVHANPSPRKKAVALLDSQSSLRIQFEGTDREVHRLRELTIAFQSKVEFAFQYVFSRQGIGLNKEVDKLPSKAVQKLSEIGQSSVSTTLRDALRVRNYNLTNC